VKVSPQTHRALAQLKAKDSAYLQESLRAVAHGNKNATAELAAKTGVSVSELQAAAESGFDALFQQSGDTKTAVAVGGDQPKAFAAGSGGSNAVGLAKLRFDRRDDVAALAVTNAHATPMPTSSSSAPVYGVRATGESAAQRNVPSLADVESVRAGDLDPATMARALKEALLSPNPQVVKKAARTLQVVESYARKAAQDKANYAGTGFVPFTFPKVDMRFTSSEAAALAKAVATTRDPATVDIVLMATRRGALAVEHPSVILDDKRLAELSTGGSGLLMASEGTESPRDAKSFHDEWVNEVEPGMRNIREAIIETAAARGASCPYARGNHAKGVEFENVKMKTADDAPEWVKDLFGDVVEGGMIRVSGSQTDPDEPDSQPHQPGVRLTLPLKGRLEDGSATQIFDVTANSGNTTHANTGRKHTHFTKSLTTTKRGIFDVKPLRVARFVGGGILQGEARERIGQIKSAMGATKAANQQPFHEHDLFARHAYFVGGRYVQIRLKVIEPRDFPNPVDDKNPNARLDAVSDTVAARGMKVAMYITEIPQGRAELAEEEGWTGLESTEVLAGVFEVPPQVASSDSAAARYMQKHAFIPGGEKMVATGVGLGRHRVAVYQASQDQRHERRR
jgi:hypothetical protein